MFTWNSTYHYLCGMIAAKLGKNPIFHPLITTFEITYRCNLRCGYCSDGSGVKCPDVPCEELSTSQIVSLFQIVRRVNDIVGITGGEPLLRDDIVEVLKAAKAMGLNNFLTTILIILPQALRVVIPAIVGQFIALFMDTTLAVIVGLLELLAVGSAILNSNPQWLLLDMEVYTFIAVVFWVFTFSMAYASRRLETAVGLGTR